MPCDEVLDEGDVLVFHFPSAMLEYDDHEGRIAKGIPERKGCFGFFSNYFSGLRAHPAPCGYALRRGGVAARELDRPATRVNVGSSDEQDLFGRKSLACIRRHSFP